MPGTCFVISTDRREGSALPRVATRPARMDGSIEIAFAPVNRVGEPVIFKGVPTGNPGIPGNGLPMPAPETVWRPVPGGPRIARSVSI